MIDYQWLPRPAAYPQVWQAMRDFTEARDAATPDRIWLVEHEPVYTLGQAGKPEHILNSGGISIVQCDRGGQVRSEEHTSELQSLMRISYAVFCLKKKQHTHSTIPLYTITKR